MRSDAILADARSLRLKLHDTAEISFQETETSRTLAAWLGSHGLSVTAGVAETGLVVEVEARVEGPTRLFRADIDAIGTTEDAHEVNLGLRLARTPTVGGPSTSAATTATAPCSPAPSRPSPPIPTSGAAG